MVKILHEDGKVRNALEILVWELNGDILNNPIQMLVTNEEADWAAVRLSRVMPNAVIALTVMSRHKARYKNGERIFLKDYREYYAELTDEQYTSTLIRDSNGNLV